MRVRINGMGRIGRLAAREAIGGIVRDGADPRAGNQLDIVHLNDIGGLDATVHLLEFDSNHGRWRAQFEPTENCIDIDGRQISFTAEAKPEDVPWGEIGCDIVLECTGRFRTPETLAGYFERGVKRVIFAAPVAAAEALNIVVGVNDSEYDPSRHN